METTTTLDTLNATGWYCPQCGNELIRAGGPNAPEVAICNSGTCAYQATIAADSQEG